MPNRNANENRNRKGKVKEKEKASGKKKKASKPNEANTNQAQMRQCDTFLTFPSVSGTSHDHLDQVIPGSLLLAKPDREECPLAFT